MIYERTTVIQYLKNIKEALHEKNSSCHRLLPRDRAGGGFKICFLRIPGRDQLRQKCGPDGRSEKKKWRRSGAECLAVQADVGNPEDCKRLFQEIGSRFGHIDVLVNNAGISIIGLLQYLSFESWNRIVSANLSSVFHCAKLAIPGMIHNHSGKIINISSVWGVCGASCEAAYSATKGGVNGLTMALAKELAPSGIQVNAIACGAIDTEMNGFLSEEEHEMLLDEIPAGRMGKPEEVADLVLKLVEAPDYLTGQVIKMDGGWI